MEAPVCGRLSDLQRQVEAAWPGGVQPIRFLHYDRGPVCSPWDAVKLDKAEPIGFDFHDIDEPGGGN